ncbi:MAG: sporulation protein YqfD [Oscillospiraceae bacterium]|jgi:sporulation protein YqfD|nr:sporulation protein YqfD [Oscillospiraceae bacterium]MCI1991230.1 sporulation protein YqfD [Oscillospiraceae bacterium]MCI2035600.1 sporulation protein YqfD [Oscillospiraceae bacterium]
MISLRLTRWLIGYVRFSVLGGSPERFYSFCARSGAYLWDIAAGRSGGACVAARRYRLLRAPARRAGCRLRVRERRGLPFLLRRTGRHPGLWAGAAVFALIVSVLSRQVWCIRVTGNASVPVSGVEQALASAGLSQGAWKSAVEPQKTAQQVMLKFPQIRWMSINLKGSAAEVVIQEKTAKPPIENRKNLCNIKASATGQIVSMKVYAGTPMVQKGDAVVEGQLLVSAVVVDKLGGNTLTHASAEVVAETTRSLSVKIDRKRQKTVPTGKTVYRRNLDLFGARLPVSFQGKPRGNYRVSREKFGLSLFGTPLPAGLYQERWDEVRTVDYTLAKDQARALAKRELAGQEKKLLNGGRVTGEKITENWAGGTLVYSAKLTCQENIAKESEIFLK